MPEGDGGTRDLRVALVCPYSLSRPGGVQGQVLGLARSLSKDGHEVAVFAPVDGPVAPPEGVDLVATGHSTSLRGNGSVAPVSVSPVSARRGLADLRDFAPDVVHIHEPFAPGLTYALLVAKDLPPIVATFHRSGGSVLYALLSPVARRLAGRLAARCAVSNAAAATASHALDGTYEVLFNGIETDHFVGVEPWPTTGPSGLFLGRHEERKGLAVLLEAWQLLDGTYAAADTGTDSDTGSRVARPVLWVAGDGPETEVLRRRHPESDSVRWLGVVDEDEKIRRLVAADVLAAPALGGESFGMVLLEAMAARTVVVASDIEGYRDAAGGCAVLVPPGDPRALAAALGGVLRGTLAPARPDDGGSVGREADGSRGRSRWLEDAGKRAERWSMTSLAERYEEIYRSVLVGDRS
ncbi:MAG: glycosyltransferase family 4 protein [Acidimicrobiales bacterium]